MTEQAEQIEPLSRQLIPIILGLVADIVMRTIAELPLPWRMLIIVILGIIYLVFDLARRHPKQVTVSPRAANLLLIALVVAIILIGAASLILALSLSVVIFLIGWLILMIIFIRFAQSLPATSVVPKSILMGVAAVSLGTALSMGGGPVIDFVTVGPVQLTIRNNCPDPLPIPVLNIEVPANGSQTISAPPVSVTVRREQGEVCVRTGFDQERCFPIQENAEIIFDDRPLTPGDSLLINLRERREHKLVITCR